MAESSDWDDILQSMDFQQQSQYPMDVAPAKSWCFSDQHNRTPSLVGERSRIGSPASSPSSTSKRLPLVQEWYLDQSNFLPPVEDDETTLIASPHDQHLQQPTVDFFDMAQMAERLAELENRYVDDI